MQLVNLTIPPQKMAKYSVTVSCENENTRVENEHVAFPFSYFLLCKCIIVWTVSNVSY